MPVYPATPGRSDVNIPKQLPPWAPKSACGLGVHPAHAKTHRALVTRRGVVGLALGGQAGLGLGRAHPAQASGRCVAVGCAEVREDRGRQHTFPPLSTRVHRTRVPS